MSRVRNFVIRNRIKKSKEIRRRSYNSSSQAFMIFRSIDFRSIELLGDIAIDFLADYFVSRLRI